jgi:hypothetical protein
MNDVTFFGLSDAGMVAWVCAMGLWTMMQIMVNVARRLDKN